MSLFQISPKIIFRRGLTELIFKLAHKTEQVNLWVFFTKRECKGLRGHAYIIEVNKRRLNSKKFLFSNRATRLLNMSPWYVVLSMNIKESKKECLLNHQWYKYLWIRCFCTLLYLWFVQRCNCYSLSRYHDCSSGNTVTFII